MLSSPSRRFLAHVADTRSMRTHDAYANDLRQYEAWLGKPSVTHASPDDVEHYLMYLETEQGRTGWSTHRAATTLRQLYKFLGAPLPKKLHQAPKTTSKMPSTRRALSVRDMRKLFAVLEDNDPAVIRDRAMFSCMYGLGFTNKDIIDLNLDQIALDNELIRPFGKSGNRRMTPRVVPLDGVVFDAMDAWITEGRDAFELHRGTRMTRNAAFIGRNGGRLTRQGLDFLLKERAREAGITDSLSPIWLRDSFVKHMLAGGASVEDINLISGSIAFTTGARNTREYVAHARKVLRKCHPLWR